MTDHPSQNPHPDTCRFIEGDPRRDLDWSFCGAPTLPGKSWCPEHAAIVFVDPKPRRHPDRSNGTQL